MTSLLACLLCVIQPAEVGKTLPPPGIKISEAERVELTKECAAFEQEIKAARQELSGQPRLLELFPDVLIFHKAVDWALRYDEFYDPKEVKAARDLLKRGRERLEQIKSRKPEYLSECGLVVRGYVSRIDGSVQPYGLVVPEGYTPKTLSRYRLDVWLHGRGDKLTELAFLDQRLRSPGEFTPEDAFVLHPYGRYCNAFKFAGETDVFEALEHCKKHYRIDSNRLVVRGFSMGGAGCWHLAVHHPDKWCAAAPGAGFAETPEYARINKDEVPAWEQKLWHWYNATDYAENLKHLPTIAYSGENDKQRQAADVMAREMKKFDMTLRHIIGPRMGHAYHPEAKREIERTLHNLVKNPLRSHWFELSFQTWTLRYAQHKCIRIEAMEEQWKPAKIETDIRFEGMTGGKSGDIPPIPATVKITTHNVAGFSMTFLPNEWREIRRLLHDRGTFTIDGQFPGMDITHSSADVQVHFKKGENVWKQVDSLDDGILRKKPGLQGPIDDAFLDSFLIVKPSGKDPAEKVNAWVDAEMNRASIEWRRQFRGIPRVKFDKDVTEADINNHHLVLWGTPESNSVIKKLTLPITWKDGKLIVHQKSYDAGTTVPILIYPNPLNPGKYIVLNSGHTFREESNRSNARQTPKLPDWAIIDIITPPNGYHPGKVLDAGFFGERWEWKD
jgi:dienelactone hydrolase